MPIILDYLFFAILVAAGWIGFRNGRKRTEKESTAAFILLNFAAIPCVLLLLSFLPDLLSPSVALLQEFFDMSLYFLGLPLLILPLLPGASWLVGFTFGRYRSGE